jgi:ketosteroid isomerase-like protein
VTSSRETAVLAANQSFYHAFAEGDADAMVALWAREHAIACTHPGRAPLQGREAVLASWAGILGSAEAPDVRISRACAIVVGEAALVTCIEHVGGAELAASNMFVLEGGEWRLVQHHAGLLATRAPRPAPVRDRLN